ncbi:Histone-Lysine N-Methyltransferase ash1l [Dermatophagoides pteronyssinus]|uniref:Histone-Lysine N-Methyltransferase ash1l n=1 Tax=Dermatophagoides pteronyssinus TaxID=6956 RepID=A0ABQ8JGX3_DERPT|nr:Histone-Lysine N-Methyltransferase ash1l [Dermatophagoides pteronyssinus]
MYQSNTYRRYKILTTRISMNFQREYFIKFDNTKGQWFTIDDINEKFNDITNLKKFVNKFNIGFSTKSIKNDPFEGLVYVQCNRNAFFDLNDYIPNPEICSCANENRTNCRNYYCVNWTRGVECSPACPMGIDCSNRPIQMISNEDNLEIFITKHCNFGVKTNISFDRDTFIAEYKGVIRSNNDPLLSENYSMDLGRTTAIDASLWCNKIRFLNHSCLPNAKSYLFAVDGHWRLAIFSMRNISVGEELTIDYGPNFEENQEICFCQSPNCAGIIGGNKNFEFEMEDWQYPLSEKAYNLQKIFNENYADNIPIY